MTARQEILQLVSNRCGLSQTEIAKCLNISRQRVSKIMSEEHLVLPSGFKHRYCLTCGLKLLAKSKYSPKQCPSCRLIKHQSLFAVYPCDECGKESARAISSAKQHKHHFCNHRCQGNWLAKQYGFLAHPENKLHRDNDQPLYSKILE